jgi:hypothetical protein
MSLTGPSRTIVVEPLKAPAAAPVPVPPPAAAPPPPKAPEPARR